MSKAELLRKLGKAVRDDVMIWAHRKHKGKKALANVTICTVAELKAILKGPAEFKYKSKCNCTGGWGTGLPHHEKCPEYNEIFDKRVKG